MICDLEFVGERGGLFVHRCKNCGDEIRSKREQSRKRTCHESGAQSRLAILPPPPGPGTELAAIFAELGIKPRKSCGCKGKAKAMDAWGIVGCEEHRDEILAWMSEAYDTATWSEKASAAWNAMRKGLPLTLAGILDLAIERAGVYAGAIKVAFLAPSLLLGGAERWIASLCRHFDKSKVWPAYIALTEPKSRSPIVETWLPPCVQVVSADMLPQVMDRVDVLIAWGTQDLAERTKGRKCKLIEAQHGTMGFGKYQGQLAKAAIDSGAELTAVGEACLENFPEDVRSSVTVIQNGAETDRLQPVEGRDATRAKLGIKDGERVCLFIGRLARVKNLDGLAAAVALLPGWRLVVAGPEYQKHHCLGDAIVLPSQEHLGDLMAAADVFCAPSHHEANSLAVIEAWLAGVPTVTTDYPAAKAMEARHGRMSWLAPLNPAPQVLAAAIQEAGKWRGTLPIQRVQGIALKHYTGEAMALRWQTYIQELAHARV